MVVFRVVSAVLIISTSLLTMVQTGGLTCASDDGGYQLKTIPEI